MKLLVVLCFWALTSIALAVTDSTDTVGLWHFDSTYQDSNLYTPDDDCVMNRRDYDLELRNGADITAGSGYDGIDHALELDGTDDFGTIVWKQYDNIKVDFFFNADTLANNIDKYFVEIADIFRLYLNGSNLLTMTVWDTSDPVVATTKTVNTAISVNTWYRVVASYDYDGNFDLSLYNTSGTLLGSQSGVYGNGVLAKYSSIVHLVVGAYRGSSRFFNGQIDEMKVSNYSDVIDARLERIIYDHINYPYPDPESVDSSIKCSGIIAYALACLYEGQNLTVANNYINYFEDNYSAPDDYVFGDFDGYFQMPLVLRCYLLDKCYGNLTSSAKTDIETMMWKFINKRSLISQAVETVWVMSYSENHDLVRKTSYMLCAQALKDSASYGPDVQLNDGYTIAQHYNAWNDYLHAYFRERAREGLNTEIASPTYQKETMGCYYNVRDLAQEQSLPKLAEDAINLFYADSASEFMPKTGIRGGAEIRCYKDNKMFLGNRYSLRQWVYAYDWHDIDSGSDSHHYILLMATSDYRVPPIITAISTDAERNDYLYTSRRFGQGSTENESVENISTITFGDDNSAGIRRDTYVSKEYIMGSIAFDQNESFTNVTNQNRMMGVFFAYDIDDRIAIHGEGWYNNKSYADLTGVCGKSCMVVSRDMNAYSCGDNTQIFISDGQLLDNKEDDSGWIFTKCGPYGAEDRKFVFDQDQSDNGRDNDLLLGLQDNNTSADEPTLSFSGEGYDSVGKSLVFDGDDIAYTSVAWKNHETVYIDLWFYLDRVDLSNQVLVTATSTWQLAVNYSTLNFTVWTNGTASNVNLSSVTLSTGTWTHAIASVDEFGHVTLQIGESSVSYSGRPMIKQDKEITFGNKYPYQRYLNGRLDEVKISLYDTSDTILGYWQMENVANKDSYMGICIANSGYSVSQDPNDLLQGTMLELTDQWSPVIVQMGSGADYNGFSDFKNSVKANTCSYSNGKLTYISENNDTYEYFSNSVNLPLINHQAVELNPEKTYDSPYISGMHGSDMVTVSYPGYNDLVLDFSYADSLQRDDYQTIALWHNDYSVGGYIIDDDFEYPGRDNDLYLSGAMVTTGSDGYFNECLSFDGVDDQAYLSNGWQSYRALKLGFWMKSEDTASSSNQTIINATSIWQIHQVGQDINFLVYTDNGSRVLTIENVINQDTWQYVSALIDETGYMVFAVDDQVVKSYGDTLLQQQKHVYLGNKNGYARWFDGKLDEVKITVPFITYPVACDDENTLGLWHMDSIDVAGNVPDDDFVNPQRDADLVLDGAVLTSDQSGHIGKALVFDGTDDQAYVGSFWQSYSNIRIDFWMKSDVDDNPNNQTIINATSTWQIHLVENDLSFLVYGDSQSETLTMNDCIEADKWHHVVAWVENDGYMVLTVDGKRIEVSGVSLKQQSKPLYVGNKNGYARWFDGMLDDVKILSF